MNHTAATLALILALPSAALAEEFNRQPRGRQQRLLRRVRRHARRINAVSSAVGCDLTHDEETGVASGRCSVPLREVMKGAVVAAAVCGAARPAIAVNRLGYRASLPARSGS